MGYFDLWNQNDYTQFDSDPYGSRQRRFGDYPDEDMDDDFNSEPYGSHQGCLDDDFDNDI